ncbi:hypothetical protein T310_9608 [Rasamsonia emersonii CBS 393.64]|uniref:Uncharacterized protein n=1 Tax=Rasamsonia emersonii (strain ATCC 16479 / CBS 393.64 / IMI 116815) TaxID=1408163 RepID=A0A0F4YGP2_RASE3|nr:hypothetical protein T310_9608 [Rasamsonia emersonii CBS 393.64]KKA16788.1 hypothetical protein T310_9608 [Rasamsonia emersonii CBS 393.64]
MDTDDARPPLIPCTSRFLTSLITQLASFENPTTKDGPAHHTGALLSRNQEHERAKNTLSRLPASDLSRVKSLMLTLHCLFPNELLLALDILDRRLVKRFIVREELELASAAGTVEEEEEREASPRGNAQQINSAFSPGQADEEEIYFVRSMFQPSTRGGPPKTYEVRLRSWNCTCPAFALSAFRDLETHVAEAASPSAREEDTASYLLPNDETCWFGGTLTRDPSRSSPPVDIQGKAFILFPLDTF